MRSLSSVGLALSLVFGCLFLALMAELYYLIWWKKRINNERDVEDEEEYSNFIFCWKKSSSSLRSTALNPQELCSSVRMADTQVYQPLSLLRAHQNKEIQESLRMQQQGISISGGPPRFLFTIKEETREEMESEDGRSRKGSRRRSLSDLILTVETETPYLTPMASPFYFTPPMTPMDSSSSSIRSPNDFNPLLESSTDTEFRKMRSFLASSPSPPPKFKFLKDAEEKLHRRRLREEAEKCNNKDEGNGTFIALVIAENNINNNNRGKDLSPEIHKLSSSSSSSSQCHPSCLQIVSPTIRSISI